MRVATVLEKIQQAALRFLVPLTPGDTYKIIGQEAVKLVKGEHSTIYLYQNGELNRAYSSIPALFRISGKERDIRYEVIKSGRSAVLSLELMKKIKKKYPFMGDILDRSALMIPLSYKDQTIGLLSVLAIENNNFTESQLKILNLFGSLASLAIRKTQLYDEAQKALRLRDLFISMAAHEFRTPLTSINGYIQLLQSRLSNSNTSESRWINQLYWESNRLTNLVNELLEVNRIKSGQFQYVLRECSLRKVLERVQDTFRFSYPARELAVEDQLVNRSDFVIGDYDNLIQVVSNLIDNAVKFSPSDSKIFLKLGYQEQYLIIGIRDFGSGIPKKDLPRIFEDYFRGTNVSKEGLGLGLFLVNDVIKRLHGVVKIKSRLNRGTNVEVWLPRANL